MPKVQLNFHKNDKNAILEGLKGIYSLKVIPNDKQRVCNYSHRAIGYTVQTSEGTIIASVGFQRDAETLITFIEGETYSKNGLLWNSSSSKGNGYIHLKDINIFPLGLQRELTEIETSLKVGSRFTVLPKRKETKLSAKKFHMKQIANIKRIKRSLLRSEGK